MRRPAADPGWWAFELAYLSQAPAMVALNRTPMVRSRPEPRRRMAYHAGSTVLRSLARIPAVAVALRPEPIESGSSRAGTLSPVTAGDFRAHPVAPSHLVGDLAGRPELMLPTVQVDGHTSPVKRGLQLLRSCSYTGVACHPVYELACCKPCCKRPERTQVAAWVFSCPRLYTVAVPLYRGSHCIWCSLPPGALSLLPLWGR